MPATDARALLLPWALLCALAGAPPLGAQAADAPGAQPGDTVGPAPGASSRGLVRAEDLPWVGAFAGGLALVHPARELERAVARAGDDDEAGADHAVFLVGDVIGNGLVDYALAAGTWAGGELAGSPTAARVGLRTVEALAVANVVTSLFKVSLGRARPKVTEDSREFRFFTLEDDYRSFPSGHASQIFAVAGTVSRELGERAPWVPYVAYPVAAFVGASRVVGREHWATDVISGTAVGILSARVVGRFHGPDGGGGSALRPLVAPGPGGGVFVSLSVALP